MPRPSLQLTAFKTMLQQENYVILDTETTGLKDAEICQIAIIDRHGSTLLNTYVKPTHPIPASATAIHSITNDMVQGAPVWSDVSPLLMPLLTGCDVIAFNAVFDRKMMHKSAEAVGLPKTDWKTLGRWWCAMLAFSEIYGLRDRQRAGFRYQSLQTAAKHYGIRVSGAHTALDDCLTTLAVVKAIAAQEG
jgi:DNA polymerase-3 subunit epsilon